MIEVSYLLMINWILVKENVDHVHVWWDIITSTDSMSASGCYVHSSLKLLEVGTGSMASHLQTTINNKRWPQDKLEPTIQQFSRLSQYSSYNFIVFFFCVLKVDPGSMHNSKLAKWKWLVSGEPCGDWFKTCDYNQNIWLTANDWRYLKVSNWMWHIVWW
jgi:hypothetical protein